MMTSDAALAPFRKHYAEPFMLCPPRSFLAPLMPWLKLGGAALTGALVVLMLLEIGG